MDRFVVREPKIPKDNRLMVNHPMAFKASAPRSNANNNSPDNIYYSGYTRECPTMAHEAMQSPGYPMTPGYLGIQPPQQCMNTGNFPLNHFYLGQGQMMSGIDPRYLAAYSDNAAPFIVTGNQVQDETSRISLNLGSDYENRSIVAPERSKISTFPVHAPKEAFKEQNDIMEPRIRTNNVQTKRECIGQNMQRSLPAVNVPSNKIAVDNVLKEEVQFVTRSEKLKTLYKSGPRAFSGPVEKILKWHKALQDIGVLVIYETVAKCVSIRPGESCSKNLVVRDENGPAMQVIYYEIDFLLPELKPPCTVRVVGRMMPGTCRLQAFNVRPATGDDVATLPRRAAVAAHHVAKLCKEYGDNA